MTILVAGFLASAILVVLAGTSLARNGDVIAARTRLGGLWVGSVFLAVATSRAGAHDRHRRGADRRARSGRGRSLWQQHGGVISTTHAISALVGILLMSTGLAALVYRAKGRFALLEPSSAIMVITYFAGLGVIYLRSTGQ